MSIVYYPAIIERAAEGFSVFFPDLPGCTSAGRTVSEAAINAEEALAGHILVSEEHGDELTDPSDLETIERDPEVDEVARVLVKGQRKGKIVRINVTLDENLVAAIDAVAGNRSGFLSDAASASTGSS
jgi:predicted RNase H-like HicB family nuclease